MNELKRTPKGQGYTFRIDNRTYLLRRCGIEGVVTLAAHRGSNTWSSIHTFKTTFIAAGGGRVRKGFKRIL